VGELSAVFREGIAKDIFAADILVTEMVAISHPVSATAVSPIGY
jgi:hypothetical protein